MKADAYERVRGLRGAFPTMVDNTAERDEQLAARDELDLRFIED